MRKALFPVFSGFPRCFHWRRAIRESVRKRATRRKKADFHVRQPNEMKSRRKSDTKRPLRIKNIKPSVFSGPQKGPAERGHVKKRQKSSKSVKNIFDTFRHFSRRAKNVKNRQKASKSVKHIFDTFRQLSRGTSFPAPFWGALILLLSTEVFTTTSCQFKNKSFFSKCKGR